MSRIGHVVHGQPPELVGGTEHLVAGLAADLARAGETVEVFSGSIVWKERMEVVREEEGPVPVTRVRREDLFFERWDKLENPFVEEAYARWLDAFAPDLVHVHHWARLTTTLVRTATSRGVPVVVSLHDLFASCPRYHRVRADDVFCTESPSPEVCRRCAPRWRFQGDREIDASLEVFVEDMAAEVEAASALVAPTVGHGRRVLGWLGVERPVAAIAPAGSTTGGAAARPLGDRPARPGDPLRVGTFGHLHPLKGIDVLLDAHARSRDPARLELHVWGEAPDEETARAQRARAGDRATVWHGAYRPPDLARAPVDVVVLPSLCAESYSFALDEAASLEVPVVASDLGAFADRATGRVALVPRGDAAALARQLDGLAAEPGRRRAMTEAPPPDVHDRAAALAAHRALYAEVLAGPRPPVRPEDRSDRRRRMHAARLREAGLAELLRSEGWEDVVSRLQAELAALRASRDED